MIIDLVPVWMLFLVTLGIVFLSVEMGFRSGRSVLVRQKKEIEATASSISGVILGLQAFMLAFTFSIVSDRYDQKKALVREEAKAIRTAWRRSDFLRETEREKTKQLLRAYVDQRIGVVSQYDPELAMRSMDDALRMQNQLWNIAVENGQIDMNSDIGALFVESINEIFDLHAARVTIGLQARIPTFIWVVLFSLLVLGLFGIGYHNGVAQSDRSRVTPILAIAFSFVIVLIAALDHPTDTYVPISQQPLVNLQMEMKALSVTAN